MMKKYLIGLGLAVCLANGAQAQSPLNLNGLLGGGGIPLVDGLLGGNAGIPVVGGLLGGGSIPFLSSNPGTQLGAAQSLGTQLLTNAVQSAPAALPAILLQGQSPLVAFNLPTLVDPFNPATIPGLYGSVTFLAPLRGLIPKQTVQAFFNILVGGDGPFIISGLTQKLDVNALALPLTQFDPSSLTNLAGGDIPVLGSLLGSGGIPVIGGLLGGGGGGLALAQLPLPLDALDTSTLTGLLGGGALAGL